MSDCCVFYFIARFECPLKWCTYSTYIQGNDYNKTARNKKMETEKAREGNSQGDGQKFLGHLKCYVGSQISPQL